MRHLLRYSFAILTLTLVVVKLNAQLIVDSVLVDHKYRTFQFNQPSSGAKGYHLIFILHGSGMNGQMMMQPASGLEQISQSEHILLVYPDGYKKYWNECRGAATTETNKLDINEQAFFDAMIHYFINKYELDTQNFFAIGLSGGGHMAYKLGLTMPEKFKAISVIVANLPDTSNLDCAEARRPIAVMITNGTKDDLNPYKGGEMIFNGDSWGRVRSSEGSFQYWADLAGYKGKPLVTNLPDTVRNQQTITRYTFSKKHRPEVTLLQVTGGGHAYPQDIDVFKESLQFFKREISRQQALKR